MTESHHTSRVRWQQLLPGPWYSGVKPLHIFLWDFLKDKVYVSPVPVALNNLKVQIWRAIAITEQPFLQNSWPVVQQGMKMTFVSCSLQQCIFNCCVTTAFFCSHIVCNHSVYWIWGDGELHIQVGSEPTCRFSYLELLIETWLAKTQNLKHTSLALCPFTIQNYKILLYQGYTNPGCLVYHILFDAAW